MKYIITSIVLGLSLYAGEMDRIESIVKDIENLRADYNNCKKELDNKKITLGIDAKKDVNSESRRELIQNKELAEKYKTLLESEKMKNKVLSSKIAKLEQINKNNIEKEELDLKSNKKYEKLLLVKDKENKVLQNQFNEKIKIKDDVIMTLKNQISELVKNENKKTSICEDDNPFPKLTMKKDIEKSSIETKKDAETLRSFKAATFRLNKDSEIYDSINGEVVYKWENRASFTSSKMTQNWIKITGYFVNKAWQKADRELWIKKTDAAKR